MPVGIFPVNDDQLSPDAYLDQATAKDMCRNAVAVFQDRLQPVVNRCPAWSGGASEWYVAFDPYPADPTVWRWPASTLVCEKLHMLSPFATAFRLVWYLVDVGAAGIAAMRLNYSAEGRSGSIQVPSADGYTINWGGVGWSTGTYDLSLNNLKYNDTHKSRPITININLQRTCAAYAVSVWEV